MLPSPSFPPSPILTGSEALLELVEQNVAELLWCHVVDGGADHGVVIVELDKRLAVTKLERRDRDLAAETGM